MNQKFDDFLARFVRVEPGEKRAVFTAFALMFCVMGGYFSVRPIRETVGTILGEAITDFGSLCPPCNHEQNSGA